MAARALFKRVLVGRAMVTSHLEHTLLPKILALPVFSSDALSSNAYATEETLVVLLAASTATTRFVLPIAIGIVVVLVIVVTSYRQTVRAYPSGGGAYIVSKENLGTIPGLVAAAALLTDYVLTVSVSVVAGVLAITSAAPALVEHRVVLALGFVLFITLANLRGVRESGILFAFPTYAFVLSIYVMLLAGFAQCLLSECPRAETVVPLPGLAATAGPVGLFVILRAFSSGSTALTGVEAISNGVPAFRRPQARNAASTLAAMGVITITMFLGISFLATRAGVTVSEERSVVAQIAHAIFGGGAGFYVVQFFTAAILILAANTAYQDFPRLSAIMARDRFMPRQFMNRGDRLVFSNGVIVLSIAAGALIYIFDADLTRLIQLYVVGVFTSFTLSQTGMVRHWLKEKDRNPEAAKGWRRSIAINAVGATATGVVLVVITATKFIHGAWIVILAMPVIVFALLMIQRHYRSVGAQLRREEVPTGRIGHKHVVLLVSGIDAATARALGYVRSFRPTEVHALLPTSNGIPIETRAAWRAFAPGWPDPEPLEITDGNLLEAVRSHLRAIPRANGEFVTVVVPELVTERLPLYLARRHALVRLKVGLLREPQVVIANVPVTSGKDQPDPGRPLIPQRTVVLVFVAAVHDATMRAVNYARSLEATETRAVYFDLGQEDVNRIGEAWFDRSPGIPLDVVEAPFRDLTGPMLEEVRRVTAREDSVCVVVVPEFVVRKRRHLPLHGQSALFIKRLLLYEPRVILSSVPYLID